MKYLKLFEIFKSNDIFFHGSIIPIDKLSQNYLNDKGEDRFLGNGFYITNDINAAKQFAKNKFLYKVIIIGELHSLEYYNYIDINETQNIINSLNNSNDDDYEYLSELIEEKFDENEYFTGRELIDTMKRLDINVNNCLLFLGYNSIVAPLNKINNFRNLDNSILNINVIDTNILKIELI